MIATGDPDIDKVHATVEKAIDRSEGKKSATKTSKSAKRAPAAVERYDRRLDRQHPGGVRREPGRPTSPPHADRTDRSPARPGR